MNKPNDVPLKKSSQALIDQFALRILVLDGGMGTMIQQRNLVAKDFGGPDLEGCNEVLVLTRPDVIRDIHAQYFDAGSDMVETNSFGGTPLVLNEYGLGGRALELNEASARVAREAAAGFPGPRFVAGSMGPTTKTITVTGGVTFPELVENFRVQALGLLRGGVDCLLLETSQDTRNVKAGILGIDQASREIGFRVPLMLSATIEPMGTMLAGQGVDAFYASVEHARPLSIGLNCGTGPEFMTDHLRTLAGIASCYVTCYPNAGLPDGDGKYNETPAMVSAALGRFIEQGWVNLVGGCCGTTPAYIREIARVAKAGKPRVPVKSSLTHVSGIDYVPCEESSRPLIVGERTNVTGSKKFRELIMGGKFEEAAEIGRRQVKAGAHILDVNIQHTEIDELPATGAFLEKLIRMVKAPLVIDTTNPKAIEYALTYSQGKAIINSINLEDGEEKFETVCPIALRYGAALIVGTIDEQGQAITTEAKLKVADRSYQLLTGKYGVAPQDILWDPLVFPCASGDANYIGSAKHTIDAIRALKEKYPLTKTVLGISNVSFGVPPAGREVLNAVYLYHNTKAGLDFAIVSSEKLVRYASISDEEKKLCENLLFNRGEDPIARFATHFRGKKTVAADQKKLSLDERLSRYIVEGTKEGLVPDLEEKRKTTPPLEIINGPLMKGMDEVGRLFNANELIVAEVLQSAEAMKAAVSHLELFMEKADAQNRGKMILATVKGDVHDIGKNLVEIILSNNGYTIVNLGIKCAPETLIKAAQDHRPDLIGLSGLLVKSAQQMVTTAQDLRTAGIRLPILVGGAALTKKFTYTRIRAAYDGFVGYARDAMQGLDLANQVMNPDTRKILDEKIAAEAIQLAQTDASRPEAAPAAPRVRSSRVRADEPIRVPPDLGRHRVDVPDLRALWPYVSPFMLYGKHLGVKGALDKLAEARDPKFLEIQEIVRRVQKNCEDGWMKARGLYQYFRANSDGNLLRIYDAAGKEIERFDFPRQAQPDGLCLSDFVRPVGGEPDYVCFFLTTTGEGIRARSEALKEKGEYVLSHTLQAVAIEAAEAFAEKLHRDIRTWWGFPDPAGLSMNDRFKAKYQGVRVSFGYPACPNLADQEKLFKLLRPEEIGVQLTEGQMMDPEASVSALVFHHSQA
ncbi:MAG TPA: methionine synthase, partial [Planctomycetota bacterium]|nr:methionine synthase [Planctomycetota bacterium]